MRLKTNEKNTHAELPLEFFNVLLLVGAISVVSSLLDGKNSFNDKENSQMCRNAYALPLINDQKAIKIVIKFILTQSVAFR